MRKNFKQYGQTLHLVGGNLVYISNMIYPDCSNGILSDYQQYRLDLNNAKSVSQSSIQSLETISPPYILEMEHGLLIKAFNDILDCLNSLVLWIENVTPTEIKEADIMNEISILKVIQLEITETTLGLIEKLNSQPRR
ncbi:hypothetical protein [Peribacillus muralis]|uniref:hypothetical protein n=1 Tax=Peribacillus muralis TaxID=264697 RepID=UPI003D040E28